MDCTTAKNIYGTGNGAGRSGCYSFERSACLRVSRDPRKIWADKKNNQINRHENSCSGGHRAPWARDEISDKTRSDDHRAGSDHSDGNRIEKLAVGEPVVLLDNSTVKKWDNGQAAAKDECARFSEKPEKFSDFSAGCNSRS